MLCSSSTSVSFSFGVVTGLNRPFQLFTDTISQWCVKKCCAHRLHLWVFLLVLWQTWIGRFSCSLILSLSDVLRNVVLIVYVCEFFFDFVTVLHTYALCTLSYLYSSAIIFFFSHWKVRDASAGSGSSVIGSPIAHLGSVTFSARCEISLSLRLNRGEMSLCV